MQFKERFELAVLGHSPCIADPRNPPPQTLAEHYAIRRSYGQPDFVSHRNANTKAAAQNALLVLRRELSCIDGAGPCPFTAADVEAWATEVASRELAAYNSTSVQRSDNDGVAWGWEQLSDGCCGFDLQTASTMTHFAFFVDVLGEHAAAVDPDRLAQITHTMQLYAEDFVAKFNSGHWALWNGNNWTPVLCESAYQWAIVFWWEAGELPKYVARAVTDAMRLHTSMFTQNGMYLEGVCQVSISRACGGGVL